MNINEFVNRNFLQPADAIRLRKKIFGMVDHFVIYAGVLNGQHTFIANYNCGVDIVSAQELQKFSRVLEPKEIERFEGTESERRSAMNRAADAIGKAYSYITSNCEHFKNWVQRGEWKSPQVAMATGISIGGGMISLLIAAIAGNKKLMWLGILLIAAGFVVALVVSLFKEKEASS